MSSVSEKGRNYSRYVLVVIAILLVPVIAALRVEADVAIFLSDTYEEESVPELDIHEGGQIIRHQHRWSGFQGNVPELAPIERVELALSWTVGDSLLENMVEDLVPSTAVIIDGVESHIPESESQSEESQEHAVESETNSEDYPPTVTPDAETGLTPEEPVGESGVEPSPEVHTTESGEPSEETETVLPVVSKDRLYPWAQAEGVADAVDSTPPEVTPETITQEEPASDDGVVYAREEVSDPAPVPEEYVPRDTEILPSHEISPDIPIEDGAESIPTESLTVTSVLTPEEGDATLASSTLPVARYSLDGLLWTTLGTLDISRSGSASFDLSYLTLEELPSLRIVVEYRTPEGADPVVFKDIQLEVTYGEPVLEEVISPYVPSDQEPNFLISAVIKDVTSENIRAIILERGGMYELWHSLRAVGTEEVTWQRLAGGGAVDGNTPIAIEKRTIFWIDRNQQTLFGYAVDTASLFGTPISSSDDEISTLTFTDSRKREWSVIYAPHTNELRFERAEDSSP